MKICIAASRGGPILDRKIREILEIFLPFSKENYVITIDQTKRSIFPFQKSIALCAKFLRIHDEIDILLCYLSCLFPLPLLARILRKKTIYFKGGLSLAELARMHTFDQLIYSKSSTEKALNTLELLLQRMSYSLVDKIVVASSGMLKNSDLKKYQRKVVASLEFPGPNFYNIFNVQKEFEQRDLVVGYVGRLEPIKGILQLIKALPKVISKRRDVKFLIVGDGSLREMMNRELRDYIGKNVILVGSVSRYEVANYLNELKLLLLPSFSEGIPAVLLEAMACGTPVVAAPVGGIPDLIVDGKTGFILRSNSPKCIAETILKLLGDIGKLSEVSSVITRIKQRHNYESTVSIWRNILSRW